MVAHQDSKLTDKAVSSHEGSASLGSMLRRLTAPFAMAYAATLHADEKVTAPPLPSVSATPEDTAAEKHNDAAEAQWKEWRQKFRGNIPTETAGADQFAEKLRDLSFRVSEAATLELPLSFLIQESTDKTFSVSEGRLGPLLKHSNVSRAEIVKLATAAHHASRQIEQNEREIAELERRSASLSPVMENYQRLGRRIDYQHELIGEHTAAQAKFDPTLKELRELEALHASKARGEQVDASRFKQLTRRIGLHSVSEVTEARADLEKLQASHDEPIKKARLSIDETTAAQKEIAESAFHEACDRYDTSISYANSISYLSRRNDQLVKDTSEIRNKTCGSLVKAEERAAFQYELGLKEASLTRREYTTLSNLGNTSTAFVFDRDRMNSPVLFVATNEPTTVIKATGQGANLLLSLEQPVPLHLRSINPEQTVRNYLDRNEEVVFDDKGTVSALEPLHDLSGPDIVLNLCPGSRFDLTGVRSSRRSITCEGSGTIVLGRRGQTPQDGITQRITISTNRMPEPLVISIPKDHTLEQSHIEYGSLGIRLSLHADVSIATKTSPFGSLLDKMGTDVDLEIRGTKKNVSIPLVREGKPVFDHPRKVYERIKAVE